jgi:hypothetical protein
MLDNGKAIAQGLITTFWAWGFPCSRSCVCFATAFDLPVGTTKLILALTGPGGRAKRQVSTFDIPSQNEGAATTAVVPVRFEVRDAGDYSFECNLEGQRRTISLPFLVRQREWPEFTEEEKQFATENNNVTQSLRANVHCSQCSHAFIFEESMVDDKAPGGVNRFPADGVFKCDDCGHVLRLRDIQGQLRASLKAMVGAAMGGGR